MSQSYCYNWYCYYFQTKKGKSCLTLRVLCVVLLSGQCLEVKCDITSTVGAIYNAVISFANFGELTYFGLAYMKGKCLLHSPHLAWCLR